MELITNTTTPNGLDQFYGSKESSNIPGVDVDVDDSSSATVTAMAAQFEEPQLFLYSSGVELNVPQQQSPTRPLNELNESEWRSASAVAAALAVNNIQHSLSTNPNPNANPTSNFPITTAAPFSSKKVSKAYCPPMKLLRSTKFAFQTAESSSLPSIDYAAASSASRPASTNVSPVLLLTILVCRVPIQLEHIRTICTPFGAVYRIVLFQRGETTKGLVEMDSVETAMNIYNALDGKDIFANCCHLRITFSNLPRLYVRTNTEIARDYTHTHLSSIPMNQATPQQYSQLHPYLQGHSQNIHQLMSAPQNSFVPHSNLSMPVSQLQYQHPPVSMSTPVLLVMNFRADVTIHQLFTLFSLFGDVQKIKMLYQKKGHALIQFTTPVMAAAAFTHLNNFGLYGRPIRITYSKYAAISVSLQEEAASKAAQNSLETYRDFANSRLHRYRHNFDPRKLVAPSSVLYIARLPPTITHSSLRSLMPAEIGSSVSIHFFIANERKQAFVRFASINDALEVLFLLQDNKLDEIHLKLSFSARPPESLLIDENDTSN